MPVGKKIRHLRRVQDMSQVDMALALDLTQAQVSRIEREESDVDTELLVKISKALGVSPAIFFEEDEEEKKAAALAKSGKPARPDRDSQPPRPPVEIHFSMPGHVSVEQMQRIKELTEKLADAPEGDVELVLQLVDKILGNQ